MAEPIEEDIEALWKAYEKEKTVEVRNRIAEHYLPLVRLVAGRIAISLPQHVDREDLLSSGFFGLLDAIERYAYAARSLTTCVQRTGFPSAYVRTSSAMKKL